MICTKHPRDDINYSPYPFLALYSSQQIHPAPWNISCNVDNRFLICTSMEGRITIDQRNLLLDLVDNRLEEESTSFSWWNVCVHLLMKFLQQKNKKSHLKPLFCLLNTFDNITYTFPLMVYLIAWIWRNVPEGELQTKNGIYNASTSNFSCHKCTTLNPTMRWTSTILWHQLRQLN